MSGIIESKRGKHVCTFLYVTLRLAEAKNEFDEIK